MLNRQIFESELYTYKNMKSMRYIKIDNIENINEITEIQVTYRGYKQDYSAVCDKCVFSFTQNISDGQITTNGNYVYDDATIIIDLRGYYEVQHIEIGIYIYNDVLNEKKYKVSFMEEIDHEEFVFYEYSFKEIYSSLKYNSPEAHKYNYKNMEKINPKYFDKIEQAFNINLVGDTSLIINQETYYRTIDTLFEYYNIDKVYSNIYSINELIDYPYCDEEDYQLMYRYKERSKVKISDELYFTDKKQKIEDLIEESNVPITITSNVDYAVNGKYKVNFITPFRIITVDIIIDIKENLLNALIKQVEVNNKLKRDYNSLATSINKQEANIKEIMSNNAEIIDELKNDLLKEKNNNNELKKKKEVSTKKESLKTKKQLFIPISFFIIFLIGLYYMSKNGDEKI